MLRITRKAKRKPVPVKADTPSCGSILIQNYFVAIQIQFFVFNYCLIFARALINKLKILYMCLITEYLVVFIQYFKLLV